MTALHDASWAQLSTPLRSTPPEHEMPWKDNAYLAFWATDLAVFGVVHVSTSPNAEGRRARFSINVGGRAIEVVEELSPATFTSASISFGLGSTVTLGSPRVTGTLHNTPLFGIADYSTRSIIPELVNDQPVHHFQQAAAVTGDLRVDGQSVRFVGRGFRDRTWGYREESSNIDEYIAMLVVSDRWALTAMRFRGDGGSDVTEGYCLGDWCGMPQQITDIAVRRNPSGLLAAAEIGGIPGAATATLSVMVSPGGFWVPMGWTRRGPAMSAYDEFLHLRTGSGESACGIVEHGIVRQLF